MERAARYPYTADVFSQSIVVESHDEAERDHSLQEQVSTDIRVVTTPASSLPLSAEKEQQGPYATGCTNIDKIVWPQPPSARCHMVDSSANKPSFPSEQAQLHDALYTRRKKTDDIKRLHLQQARRSCKLDGIETTLVLDLPCKPNIDANVPLLRAEHPRYHDGARRQTFPGFVGSTVSSKRFGRSSIPTISLARTEAEIRPLVSRELQQVLVKDLMLTMAGASRPEPSPVGTSRPQRAQLITADLQKSDEEVDRSDQGQDIVDALDGFAARMEGRIVARFRKELELRLSTVQEKFSRLEQAVFTTGVARERSVRT